MPTPQSAKHGPPLTTHFTWAELLGSIPRETLAIDVQSNLAALAQRLQTLRDIVGKPIQITSGYRTPAHNRAVGGESNSYHLKGMAADIVIPGMAALTVQQLLQHWSGGLGCYATFTHLDLGPRRRWGDNLTKLESPARD